MTFCRIPRWIEDLTFVFAPGTRLLSMLLALFLPLLPCLYTVWLGLGGKSDDRVDILFLKHCGGMVGDIVFGSVL